MSQLSEFFEEIMEAIHYDDPIPVLFYALFRGIIYGIIFGLYEYVVFHHNGWIGGLFIGVAVFIAILAIWGIPLIYKKLIRKSKKPV